MAYDYQDVYREKGFIPALGGAVEQAYKKAGQSAVGGIQRGTQAAAEFFGGSPDYRAQKALQGNGIARTSPPKMRDAAQAKPAQALPMAPQPAQQMRGGNNLPEYLQPNLPGGITQTGQGLLGMGQPGARQAYMPAIDSMSYVNPERGQRAVVSGLAGVAAPGMTQNRQQQALAEFQRNIENPELAQYNIVPSRQALAGMQGGQGAIPGMQGGRQQLGETDYVLLNKLMNDDTSFSRAAVNLVKNYGMTPAQAMDFQRQQVEQARALMPAYREPANFMQSQQAKMLMADAQRTNPAVRQNATRQLQELMQADYADRMGAYNTQREAQQQIAQNRQQALQGVQQRQQFGAEQSLKGWQAQQGAAQSAQQMQLEQQKAAQQAWNDFYAAQDRRYGLQQQAIPRLKIEMGPTDEMGQQQGFVNTGQGLIPLSQYMQYQESLMQPNQ